MRRLGVSDFLASLDLTALWGLHLIDLVWRACKCHDVRTRLHRLKVAFVFAYRGLSFCLDWRCRCLARKLRLFGLGAFFCSKRCDSISDSQIQPTVLFLGLLTSVCRLIGTIVSDASYILMRERKHLR